jgi:cysteine desulfuration protein SufE
MMTTTIDDLLETFDLLGDDWEERFRYIISLGKQLPGMPKDAMTEANRVQGCQSQAWLIAREEPGHTIEFLADADAFIVRGLIAILLLVYSHHTAKEILAFDITGLFSKLGLDRQLTPARSNGLHSMVKKIQAFARKFQEKQEKPLDTSLAGH